MRVYIFEDDEGYRLFDVSTLEKSKMVLIKMIRTHIDLGHFRPNFYIIDGVPDYELDFTWDDISDLPESLREEAEKRLNRRDEILSGEKRMKEYMTDIESRINSSETFDEFYNVNEDISNEWSIPLLGASDFVKEVE